MFGSRMLYNTNASSSLLNNIVAYWSYNAQNSTDSVLLITGSDTNMVYSNTGSMYQYAAQLADDSYITLEEKNELKVTTSFTISAWIKPQYLPNDGYYKGIFTVYNTGSGYGYSLAILNSLAGLRVRGTGGNWGHGNVSLATGSWVHIVAVHGNDYTKVYKNGVSAGNSTHPEAFLTHSATGTKMRIGFDIMGDPSEAGFVTYGGYSGSIDELALWSRELLALEVVNLYNAGAGKFYPFT